ncbi:hypothetical protein SAMD00019534_112820 [Acytostelium subglobosum LB1]|uniref:hypothetical protein n=1 Tax=Acytostelium subglobosum LB1 TaxID=1410327 RepID=UPI000644BC9D|nr:hypothetical protein SAMD00019534_112820 [Acytostelium subglobosum LB1]GAM28106.1 hypothetical protein SAMD00019534_112820 [Acytostelium subglobosum LB1]|eukprot:XP_012749065.1 hypothetical protein SAMD00019534_112820 [Acytostelium subglobosum LB1]
MYRLISSSIVRRTNTYLRYGIHSQQQQQLRQPTSTTTTTTNSSSSSSDSSNDNIIDINKIITIKEFDIKTNKNTNTLRFDALGPNDQVDLNAIAKMEPTLFKQHCTSINMRPFTSIKRAPAYYIQFDSADTCTQLYQRLSVHNGTLFNVRLLKSTLQPMYELNEESIEQLPKGAVEWQDTLNLPVIIINEAEEVDAAVRRLLNGKLPNDVTVDDDIVIGMDCEWPALRKFLLNEDPKVSLIQMTNGKELVLFRICHCGLDGSLRQLLQSDRILKVGYGVSKDANRIKANFDVFVDNISDIQYDPVVLRMQPNRLHHIVAKFCGVNIYRTKTESISNWATTKDLSHNQIELACNEVYYSRKLYFELKNHAVDYDLRQQH